MIKRDELSNQNSCINRAREDESVFVLLGRDVAAAYAIRQWAAARIALGKNRPGDAQIQEALQLATRIEMALLIPATTSKLQRESKA